MADDSGEVQRHSLLLARAADGDRASFHQFYVETRELIYRYVVSRVDRQLAEDLVADTYVRAFRSAGQFEDRGQPAAAWLITIARNLIASHYRRQGRRRLTNTGDNRLAAPVDDDLIDRSHDAALLEALASLKPRHRQVLQLRFLEERSVAACAVELSLSEQGVRALTYRALQAMRAMLGDDFLDGAEPDVDGVMGAKSATVPNGERGRP